MLMGMTRPRPNNRRDNAPRAAESSLANGTNAYEKRAMFDLWHITHQVGTQAMDAGGYQLVVDRYIAQQGQ